MLTEQFIQDAICHPKRMQRVVQEICGKDWLFDEHGDQSKPADVLNQEFNFAADGQGGRIDVIATFNSRRKLVICEVKALPVSDVEVQQLKGYLEKWESLREADETLANVDEVIGILLSDSFMEISRDEWPQRDAFLVKFEFQGTSFPFHPESPRFRESDNSESKSVLKRSRLSSVDSHRGYLKHEQLRAAFSDIAECCLAGDPRREWVIQNPQGGHVAVHYKGEYVAYVFVQRNSFDVGFTDVSGVDQSQRLQPDDVPDGELINEIRAGILKKCAEIDEKLSKMIPMNFHWDTAINNRTYDESR